MKKVISRVLECVLAPALATVLVPAVATAQILWLGGHTSLYDYGGDPTLQIEADRVMAPGLQFGYQPSRRWSFHGWWERGDVSTPRYRAPKFELGLVSARMHSPRPTLSPWLGLGVGEVTLEAESGNASSDTVAGPELGIDWLFHDNWSLGVGARALYSDSYSDWDYAAFLTLDFRLRLGHNHLPRVQAFREARDRNAAPVLPLSRQRCLAQPPHSPRARRVSVPVTCERFPYRPH